jgi:pyruvate decarboxylase
VETFAGLYIGDISAPGARAAVENADALISVGLVANDLNTGGFTARVAGELVDQPSYVV